MVKTATSGVEEGSKSTGMGMLLMQRGNSQVAVAGQEARQGRGLRCE